MEISSSRSTKCQPASSMLSAQRTQGDLSVTDSDTNSSQRKGLQVAAHHASNDAQRNAEVRTNYHGSAGGSVTDLRPNNWVIYYIFSVFTLTSVNEFH